MARVSIGRSRLPPDEIRWVATSGIIATSDPVRARIVELTRSMSGATSSARRLSEAEFGLSKGRTTAKIHLRTLGKREHRNATLMRQVRYIVISMEVYGVVGSRNKRLNQHPPPPLIPARSALAYA